MIDSLSPRERRVMEILAEGYNERETADKLFISPHTVATHVSRVKRKLKARNRVHAILIFARHQFAWRSALV